MLLIDKIYFELINNSKSINYSFIICLMTISPFFIYHISLNRTLFYLLVVLILFFFQFISKFLFNILVIYINISGILILHTFLNWGTKTQILEPFLELIFYTNSNEITEYFSSYFGYYDSLILIYYLLLTIILFLFNRIEKIHFTYLRLFSILIITSVLVFLHFVSRANGRIPFYKVYPLGLITSIENTLGKTNKYSKRNDYLNNKFIATDSFTHKQSKGVYDKVIIILGESANKNYMGVYNNSLKTTPFLSSISDELILLNSISPATQTHLSIPIMFSNLDYTNLDDFSKTKSLITDFKLNRYRTFWISNQEGVFSDFYGPIQSIANESDYSYFANLDYVLAEPDEIILNKIKEKIIPDEKQMFTIHLMGSHRDYDKRYSSGVSLYRYPKNLVEKYQNTIYYNDFVLRSIFKLFNNKKEKVLIVYTSDHGETIDLKTGGHGYFNPYKDSVDVPLIFFSNIQNDRIFEIKKENTERTLNNESFYSIINYINYMQDEYLYSSSKIIFSQNTENIRNYDKMEYN